MNSSVIPSLQQQAKAFADQLDGGVFWRYVEEQARIGALSPRGIRRLALDAHDNEARLWLAARGRELGCTVAYDDLANVFLRREGADPSLPPLLLGSHMDSQPSAGAYDGALGVMAGLAILQGLQAADVKHRRAIEVVAWTNEEGARFAPGTSGSSWFAGARTYEDIVSARDDAGIGFGEALQHTLALLQDNGLVYRSAPLIPHAYLEFHIEQGPILEQQGVPLGVVAGIQGVHWYEVIVHGKANHAGTTPRSSRADALDGAHSLISAMKEAVYAHDDRIRFTIGKFSLAPGSVNTIPSEARFTVDLRHPEQAVLQQLDQTFGLLAEQRWSNCRVELVRSSAVAPVKFTPVLIGCLSRSAKAYCEDAPVMVSGAFHDAIHLIQVCPTAMLFTTCRDGLSHHPDEQVERADAEVALRAFAMAAYELIQ
jgi:N-carbamoyl-L-amino-acid hydrolase